VNICLVTSSYPRFEQDGNARFVRSIAEAQAARGHKVHVVAPFAHQVRPYPSPVRIHWFRYIWPAKLGAMGHAASLENDRRLRGAAAVQTPLFALGLALRLHRIIRRWQIDLVHAHWVVPAGFLAAWIAGLNRKPLFISLHGSDMYLVQRSALIGGVGRWALRRAQGITACSPPLAEAAIHLGALPERVHLLPYGADPTRFMLEQASPALRWRLDLLPEDHIILGAGRLVAKKGFDQLVRALPRVLAAVPRARLVILGEGPEREGLERLIGDMGLHGKVFLPGSVPWSEMPASLAACEVFVMPSVRDVAGNLDGQPTVILEAMAAGRPVVATRLGGIPLAVQPDRTGLLVDESDPEQLSTALIRLLTCDEERQRMGRVARARIESELNWSELARRLDRIYQAC